MVDVRPFDRLSVKQAIVTLAIAALLGILASGWDLLTDYRAQHERNRASAAANMALVRGTAVEAAYQLSNDLAGEVVRGLANEPAVAEVVLTDNFGGVLGRAARPGASTPFPRLANALFGDIAHAQLALETVGPDGASSSVGTLAMSLDPAELLNRFLARLLATVVSGAARAVLLCVLVVGVFYLLITKPLLRITAAIATVDPARPGAFPIAVPKRHDRDELGLLARTINRMLAGFQEGLDGRDQAEGALAALARDLEIRVKQRTAELAREKEGVESALAQLNLVNGELEKANGFINDGIRYASRIQTALLPDADALSGVVGECTVGWHPLGIVGGDYYWAGRFGGKGVVVVVDCTGHGVPGAFMTAVVASALGRILHHHAYDDPAEILAHLNRLVKSALRQDRDGAVSNDGLDAGICVIDPETRTVGFAGANLPLLVRSGAEFRTVPGDRMSLGYVESPEDCRFTLHRVPYGAGDSFYLFTDGVADQVGGPHRRLLGRRRVESILAEVADHPLEAQKAFLFERLDAWRKAEPRRDDMTFLAFRPG
ncbi:MAG: SpoIIE family protein phosphatase [Magnetospirillum sp.]|nr:SpoIIE family protein phosphatase [Magnetospirillum sp.]